MNDLPAVTTADTRNVPTVTPGSLPAVCQGVPYMTSLEIADMTGIRHDNVMRDIARELGKIGEGLLRFEASYLNAQNKRQPCYALPGEYLLFIASAYDAKLRMQIIRHWAALNNGTAQPVKDAANVFVARLVEGTRAERKARIAADMEDFRQVHGRRPNAQERFLIGKP